MFSIYKKLSFADVFSILNLTSGIAGILTGILSFIFISAIFDGLDGMTARRMGNSEIGEELDSLSDLISFGVLPAFFLVKKFKFSPVLVIIAAIYVTCSALRLARFNVVKSKYFIGLPTTASALILTCILKINVGKDILIAISLLLSLAMICDLKFPKIRDSRLLFLGGFAVLGSIFSLYGVYLLLVLCIVYVLQPLLGWFK
ncbi:MAG: CDP-diacylglycerol--serine O-phosphatidyltransferase [Archaeoglobus sp.]|jgi:CDP-diacylglycerol--serine O-phosphatidyltransferase|nr:MAG: CDP-diacylglycerol--serine O-phosphatidyltransferase [Archaeoglobus sp.]